MDWAYCKNGQGREGENGNRVETNYSKKDWQTDRKIGG